MTYAVLQKTLFGIVALYVLVSFSVRVFGAPGENLYPFFSWSLYAWVPARVEHSYDIRLTAVRGHVFPHPVSLLDMPELYAPRTPVNVRDLIQNLGDRVRQGESTAVLEEGLSFLPASSYELFRLTYNPIAYWQKHEVLDKEALTPILTHQP
jgi:hypothetical protein